MHLERINFFSVQTVKIVLNGYGGSTLSKPYDVLCFHVNTCHHNGKGNSVCVHAIEALASADILPLILNVSTTVNHHILI
jgi:hypothetical protein